MATRNDGHGDRSDGVTRLAPRTEEERSTGAVPADAAGRALGSDVRVVSRSTVVDGTVRHEIGFERRPGV